MNELEKSTYYSLFEKMGEPAVRAHVESGAWEDERTKLLAARMWLNERAAKASSKPWHETALGIVVITVVSGVAVGGALYWLGWLS